MNSKRVKTLNSSASTTAITLGVNAAGDVLGTGANAGEYPKSWIKITLLVLAILLVVFIVLSMQSQ